MRAELPEIGLKRRMMTMTVMQINQRLGVWGESMR